MSTNHFSLESQLFVYYPKYLTNMEPHHQSEYFSRLRTMKTLWWQEQSTALLQIIAQNNLIFKSPISCVKQLFQCVTPNRNCQAQCTDNSQEQILFLTRSWHKGLNCQWRGANLWYVSLIRNHSSFFGFPTIFYLTLQM